MAPTQKHRKISFGSPLGADALMLETCHGTEGVSELFSYEVDLLSTDHAVDFNKIVGHNVTIRIQLEDGKATRYINGYVATFRQGFSKHDLAGYRAEVVPWLWFLTQMSDCRIFQKKTVKDIITEVFNDAGFANFKWNTSGTFPEREYCVQYRETAFDFVSRLMEEEGIYYYFEHADGAHTMTMVDDVASLKPFESFKKINFNTNTANLDEVVTDWIMTAQVRTISHALNDFDFISPRKPLRTVTEIPRQDGAPANLARYDYPGEYTVFNDGERYSRLRIEALQAQYETRNAISTSRGIAAGHLFELAGYPRKEECREYLILRTSTTLRNDQFGSTAHAAGEPLCRCAFTVMPKAQPYRPPRLTPHPMIRGPQTAIVVGPKGEEIYTDKYGRVKVQFHWDRYGEANDKSSCWIRVSQAWAGTNWGAMYIPRIGQEVIIEFLEGDPDQPIITGRVYNGAAMPPYDLPNNQTVSTIKSNTTPKGGGFNEFRFEDKKDKEQIFMHAQRDMDIRVLKDHRTNILGDMHETVGEEGGNHYEQVTKDRHTLIDKDNFQKVGGDQHELVEGDKLDEVSGDHGLTVGGDRKEKVDGDEHLKVGMNQSVKVGMTHSLDAGMEIHAKAGKSFAIEGGMQGHVKAGMTLVVEAGMQLTLKAGAGFITIGPAGVDISGPMVKINSGGAAGSGAGAKPKAPKPPDKPKKPKKPDKADDDKAGKTDKAEGKADKTKKGKESKTKADAFVAGSSSGGGGGGGGGSSPPPSPAAAVLKQAAEDGTPFCEECEKARQAKEAKS